MNNVFVKEIKENTIVSADNSTKNKVEISIEQNGELQTVTLEGCGSVKELSTV